MTRWRQFDCVATTGFHDPEGLFYLTRLSAHVGDVEGAVRLFERVVAGGFCCFPSFARDSWLDGLRGQAEFRRVLSLAEARHREAVVAFRDAGGEPGTGRQPRLSVANRFEELKARVPVD